MSGGLLLRVNLYFRGKDLAEGTLVLANVYPTARARSGLREILIPAGEKLEPKRFDVEPGRYVVEVVMPSGKILSEEATVVEGRDVGVDIDDWESPHESHGWQYLAGNLEPRNIYYSPSTIPISRSLSSRYSELLNVDLDAPAERSISARLPTPEVVWIPESRTGAWSFETMNKLSGGMDLADRQGISGLATDDRLIPISGATETDGTSHLYRFDGNGPIPAFGPVPLGERQFVIMYAPPDAFLVTLPTPWADVYANDVQVELMFNARRGPTGSPVAVTVRDRAIGTGLEYLAGGALSAAATVFGNVENMLYEKWLNPIAAAAGAYVLVGTESDQEWKPWHEWLKNLRNRFVWMSDGAILWAVHALRNADTNDQIREARKGLVEAYRRGVPFLTLGLSWLMDGLSDFPDDEECRRAVDQVRRLSWKVDMRQPFVVLRLNERPR